MKRALRKSLFAGICVTLALLATGSAGAGEGPGFVDPSAFTALADEDSELVEISLGKSILGVIAAGFAAEKDVSEMLTRIDAINAVIVGVGEDPKRIARATRLVQDVSRRLEGDRWERLAKIRDEETELGIYTRTVDQKIVGLVVVGLDRIDRKAIFVNIAGIIDLARIRDLGEMLDVPGLDELPD